MRFSIELLSLVLILSVASPCLADSSQRAQELLAKFPPIEKVNNFIKADPNNGSLYAGRAAIYELKRQFPSAIDDWNKAADLKYDSQGHDTDLYTHRGLCYFGEKNFDAALADFQRALTLAPNDAYCLANRGAIYTEKNQCELALKDLTDAVKLNPKDAWFHSELGQAYFKTKQYSHALECLDNALKMDGTRGDAFYYRGLTLRALGKETEARAALVQANKLGFKAGDPSTYLPIEP